MHSERAGLGSQPSGDLVVQAGDDRKTVAYKMARARYESASRVNRLDVDVATTDDAPSTSAYSGEMQQLVPASGIDSNSATGARALLK